MIDAAIIDWGTPRLAARCAGSLDHPLFSSIEIVDARARGLTYAQATNRSLARGTGDIVLALNADTRMLEPDAPDKIVALFQAHPDVAVIGPRQVDDHGRVTHAGIVGDNLRRAHRHWLQPLDPVAAICSEELLDVPTISGAVYFCRRAAWEKFGGFHEGCRHFYEETALDFQIRHAGHRVCYTGAVTWEHLFSRSPVDEQWRAQAAAESRSAFLTFLTGKGIQCG